MTLDRTEMNRRLVRLAKSPEVRVWRLDESALSAPELVFRDIWELEAEVNNGGFYQYFWNTSGARAPHATEALRSIGAGAMAEIVRRAVSAVGEMPWRDEIARRARLDALTEEDRARLDALDHSFYAYPDDLTTLLYRYVTTHRSEIHVPAGF